MALPLRTGIYITALCIAIILGGVLTLGVRQYQLHSQHQKIIVQSEKLLVRFAAMREQIVQALLSRQSGALSRIAQDVEAFQVDLSQVMSNRYIPDEFKLAFMNQVDLPGLVLMLRDSAASTLSEAEGLAINRQTRQLGERLMIFNRMIIEHAKSMVIGFQRVVIGALAIVLFCMVGFLILGHRYVATPLIGLAAQVRDVVVGRRSNVEPALPGMSEEVSGLAASFHDLIENRHKSEQAVERRNRILYAALRAGVAARQAGTQQELFREVCRALLYNEDYCLVWAGVADDDGAGLTPVAADGVLTSDHGKKKKCMAPLLLETQEQDDPALEAFRARRPVVRRNLLADIPRGHLQDTPLAAGLVDCACLPLLWEGQAYGVLSIYTNLADGFSGEELRLLDKMAGDLGFALYFLRTREELLRKTQVHEMVNAAAAAFVVGLAPDGLILTASAQLAALTGCEEQELVGSCILDLSAPASQGLLQEIISQADALDGGRCEEIVLIDSDRRQKKCRCCFAKNRVENGGSLLLCVGVPVCGSEHDDRVQAAVQLSRLAVLGELASGLAHEVNNLCNGIINYAQVLADEAAEEGWSARQAGLVRGIISEGERIAAIVRNILQHGSRQGRLDDQVHMRDVVEEALALINHQLKNDGIAVHMHFAHNLPALTLDRQSMQHVFLNIFNNACYALNGRYNGKGKDKYLDVTGEIIPEDGTSWLRTTVTDRGVGIAPQILPRIFEPGFSTKPADEGTGCGLSISRELVQQQHGRIMIESEPARYTAVKVDLPLR